MMRSAYNSQPDWLSFDPLYSLNAPHISSWRQDFEIKLLVKLRINSSGLTFDMVAENNLHDFIKMKLKNETKVSRHGLKNKEGRNAEIMRDLSKWMKDNYQSFVREYEPGQSFRNLQNRRKKL